MAEITAREVMALRNRTGLSMMACKRALEEAGGDPEVAEDLLRKQLKGKMEARADRAAGEGRIAIAIDPAAATAAIVELRAETDFTARNESFVSTAEELARLALTGPVGAIEKPTEAMAAPIDRVRIATGENVSLARARKLAGTPGRTVFGSYIHHDGKTGVLIQAEGDIGEQTLRQVCMHIAAAVPRPLGVGPEDIPPEVVEKERRFRLEQARESGKPPEIAERIVEGGMRKFFQEVSLLDQPFVIDPTRSVREVIGPAKVAAFVRWQVGQTG